MEFKSEFNLEDVGYIVHLNKVKKVKVEAINATIIEKTHEAMRSDMGGGNKQKCIYHLKGGSSSYKKSAEYIFTSPAEAVKYMLSEVEDV